MMNLVVDDVEDEIVHHAGILTERGDGHEESWPRYLRPQRVELLGGVIPQPEDLRLRPRVTVARSRPFTGGDATDHRRRDRDQFQRRPAARTHASHRAEEALAVRKRVENAPPQTTL